MLTTLPSSYKNFYLQPLTALKKWKFWCSFFIYLLCTRNCISFLLGQCSLIREPDNNHVGTVRIRHIMSGCTNARFSFCPYFHHYRAQNGNPFHIYIYQKTLQTYWIEVNFKWKVACEIAIFLTVWHKKRLFFHYRNIATMQVKRACCLYQSKKYFQNQTSKLALCCRVLFAYWVVHIVKCGVKCAVVFTYSYFQQTSAPCYT
jgi:hypothetical protein